METKFGIHLFGNNITVEPLGKDGDIRNTECTHTFEIVKVCSDNGNGHQLMKIYTNGKLKIFERGNWQITPIITMPFSWSGYSDIIEFTDKNDITAKRRGTPDSTSLFKKYSYELDIKWIFDCFDELKLIEDKEHFELMEEIRETNRMVRITKSVYIDDKEAKGEPKMDIPISSITKELDMIAQAIENFKAQEERLNEVQCDFTRNRINEIIDIFNEFTVRKLK